MTFNNVISYRIFSSYRAALLHIQDLWFMIFWFRQWEKQPTVLHTFIVLRRGQLVPIIVFVLFSALCVSAVGAGAVLQQQDHLWPGGGEVQRHHLHSGEVSLIQRFHSVIYQRRAHFLNSFWLRVSAKIYSIIAKELLIRLLHSGFNQSLKCIM